MTQVVGISGNHGVLGGKDGCTVDVTVTRETNEAAAVGAAVTGRPIMLKVHAETSVTTFGGSRNIEIITPTGAKYGAAKGQGKKISREHILAPDGSVLYVPKMQSDARVLWALDGGATPLRIGSRDIDRAWCRQLCLIGYDILTHAFALLL